MNIIKNIKVYNADREDISPSQILVSFDMKFNQTFNYELTSTQFKDIIMSESTMHSLNKLLGKHSDECFSRHVVDGIKSLVLKYYNEYLLAQNDVKAFYEKTKGADEETANILNEKVYEAFMKLRHNLPMGFEMWMTCSTNYEKLVSAISEATRIVDIKYRTDWKNFIMDITGLPNFMERASFTENVESLITKLILKENE